MSQQIDKPAYNEEFRVCDFSNVLDTGDTVTTGTVIVLGKDGVDYTSDMISDISVATGNRGLRYKLKGGIAGKRYNLEVRISTASLQKFEEPFTLSVT